MDPLQLLLSAVTVLAGCVSILFLWAKDQFNKCQIREAECSRNYIQILKHLAKVEEIKAEELP